MRPAPPSNLSTLHLQRTSRSSISAIPFLFPVFFVLPTATVFSGSGCPCSQWYLLSVCSRFAEVTLAEVMGRHPPRAFRGMPPAERMALFWALNAQTSPQRSQELLQQQAPPVRFGPNRGQAEQPRRGRHARVLSSEQRRERLAHGQSAMDLGGGEVRNTSFTQSSGRFSI